MKTKKPSRSKLVKKLDSIFSMYVRLYYSDTGKTAKCYTCGERKKIKQLQNGHFISRANYKYRRDIDNCKIQCPGCNIFKHGNYIQYTINMIRDYGIKKVEYMKNDKQLVKISTPQIEEMIEEYTIKVKQLIDKHNKKTKTKKNK